MKIAVTYEDGRIFQHFGHTEQFKIYETADGRIVRAEVVDTNGSGHGALADFLMRQGGPDLRRNRWRRAGGAGRSGHQALWRRQRRGGRGGERAAERQSGL